MRQSDRTFRQLQLHTTQAKPLISKLGCNNLPDTVKVWFDLMKAL